MSSGPDTRSVLTVPAGALPRPRPGSGPRRRTAGWWLLVLAVGLGALARLRTGSGLWLDEALSVEIARRPVPDLLEALRRDGSPPLYYLLLHAWISALGTSDLAVRALSAVASLAALPVVWAGGRRLGGPRVAAAALLLLAVNPFAVRYATEARMYALVQLLAAAGLLAVLRALERPVPARLLPVGLCAGALALTHYWSLFLLAATGVALLALSAHGAHRASALRVLGALAGGLALLLPWLPSFVFQVRRTGAPWSQPPHVVDLWYALVAWSGGGTGPAVVLTLLTAALLVLALVGHRADGGVLLRGPVDVTTGVLTGVAAGSVLLGVALSMGGVGGYAPRYTSGALVLCALAAARGVLALPGRAATALLAVAATSGLATSVPQLTSTLRTQAPSLAAALRAGLQPGDVVVYCPDQLGPAVSRLLPTGTRQIPYPMGGSARLVDWVDYAERSASASPSAFAAAVSARTQGAVWLVAQGGYRTLEGQCESLSAELHDRRGAGREVQAPRPEAEERARLTRFPALR